MSRIYNDVYFGTIEDMSDEIGRRLGIPMSLRAGLADLAATKAAIEENEKRLFDAEVTEHNYDQWAAQHDRGHYDA